MKRTGSQPPRIASWILKNILPFEEKMFLIGDFEEEYTYLIETEGKFAARSWYWSQCAVNVPGFAKDIFMENIGMFNNYFKVALRSINKNKSYTFINICGLSLGITCCLLILLYYQFEFSYDTYNDKADRIYRVGLERTYPESVRNWGFTSLMLAPTLRSDYAEVVHATRIRVRGANGFGLQVTYKDKSILEKNIFYADPNFFEVFSIKLLKGDPKTVLQQPNAVVLTEEMAEKYFGDEDPLGKTIKIGAGDEFVTEFLVTGISENTPANTHFKHNFVVSFVALPWSHVTSWGSVWSVFTYIVLEEGTDPVRFEAKLPEVIEKYLKPEVIRSLNLPSFEEYLATGNGYRLFLQPVTDIHLRSHLDQEFETNANIIYVYLFGCIAIFILLIACINFMNLSTARYANRIKEVGIRKALGSLRKQLITQFLFESILMSFAALCLALIVIELALPSYSALIGQEINTNYLGTPLLLPGLAVFVLFVGLLSGSYPAFFLSAFAPTDALKGKLKGVAKGSTFRNGLVVFQVAVSMVLIIGTLMINDQIKYVLNKDLGYNKDHLLIIDNLDALGQQGLVFKNELDKHSNIVSSTFSRHHPGSSGSANTFTIEGADLGDGTSIADVSGDHHFMNTLGLEIVQGRGFSNEIASDSTSVILNETAVNALRLRNPIGKKITNGSNFSQTIIGVVKDYHFKSLHSDIAPLKVSLNTGRFIGFITLKIRSENIDQTINHIENVWDSFTGNKSISYSFMDDNIKQLYQLEQRIGRLTGIFSIIAIGISCLGLLGLAAFTAEQKTKEVGVRKILGASMPNVVVLLSAEFVKLVGLAFIFSIPLANYLVNKWLESFAYSTNMSIVIFVFTGALTLMITLLTVSYQVIKAANQDPVKSLRAE